MATLDPLSEMGWLLETDGRLALGTFCAVVLHLMPGVAFLPLPFPLRLSLQIVVGLVPGEPPAKGFHGSIPQQLNPGRGGSHHLKISPAMGTVEKTSVEKLAANGYVPLAV